MKRRLFKWGVLLTSMSVILTCVLTCVVLYARFYVELRDNTREQVTSAATAVELCGVEYLKQMRTATRLTWISADGKILFDSAGNPESMENHLDRPEIILALEKGRGQSERSSSTLGEHFFYYAVRLNDGTVLRAAERMDSVISAIINLSGYMVLICVFVFSILIPISRAGIRRLIAPINDINLDNPLSSDSYSELAPLISRIHAQNEKISFQFAQLKAHREELETIIDNMREGLIIIDEHGNVLTMNDSAKVVFDTNDVGGNILTLNRSVALMEAVNSAISGDVCERTLELNGRFYQLSSSPVHKEGKVKGGVLLVLDVTQKQEAERMRREFSANVSHELKTPLTSILGYAEIIKDGLVPPEKISEFSSRIHSEAQRLIELVEDILKLSRLDEGIGLPKEQVDLYALAQDVCARLQNHAMALNLNVNIVGEHVEVLGVKRLLEELCFNLCDNAIKYNREGGSVTITTERVDKFIYLSVADTGVGIPPEHHERIFERFYRVDKSRASGGTGLGLSIVKHSAIINDAQIKLESKPNAGTTITLIFRDSHI